MKHRSRLDISTFTSIDISPGRTWAYMCWMFVAVTVAAVTFLMLANFTRREQVAGFLSADPEIIRVNSPRIGRIQQIVVKEGGTVRRGDVLMLVDPDPILVNGRSTAQSELDRIKTSENEIHARIRSISTQVKLKRRELSERITALRGQIIVLNEGINLQKQTVALLEEQLVSGQALAKSGALSASELQKRDAALHDGEISAQNLLFSLHQSEANLAELNGQNEQTPVEAELRLSDLRQLLIELEQRRIEAEGRLAFQVTAPADGTIDSIMIVPGQAIESSAPLVSLLPRASVLVGELYVPSRAVVFIEQSQSVRIAYSAFPYVRYGFATGKVLAVSETVLRPDEIRKPISISEPSYRVTVALDAQTMKSADKEIRLRPGLTFSADIILDRQTLALWILQSITRLWSRV